MNIVSLSLKIFTLKNTIKLIEKLANIKPIKETPENKILFLKRIVVLINHLSKYTFLRCMCLETSLIIYYFGLRNNINSDFKIGTAIKNNKIIAHAWIEVDGEVVSELEDQRKNYVAFKEKINK